MIGGPPKAALGGPGRKVSPMPAVAAVVQEKLKGKKVAVKLPNETERVLEEGEDEEKADRPLWTRRPIATSSLPDQPHIDPPEINSADVYPIDEYKDLLPPSVDVFLPGKVCSNHGTSLTSTDDHYFPLWCIMKRLLGTR